MTKRGRGEGTLEALVDVRWYGKPDPKLRGKQPERWRGCIMLGRKADGKPDRPWVFGATRAEVQNQLAELKRKADAGTRADRSKERVTVAEFMETWQAAARTSTRLQTWNGYEQITRNHIVPTLGRIKLSELRPDMIQRIYAAKLTEPQQTNHDKPLAPITVKKIAEVLHRALEMAVRWDYIARNPADNADTPAVPRRELPALHPAELNRLIDCAVAEAELTDGPAPERRAAKQWTVLWILAIHSGLREGELLALTWSEVDLERRTLTVRRNLVTVKDQTPRFGEPKSQTSRRTVSLPTEAVQALCQHKARQNEDRLAAVDWADYDLVFCTAAGTPLIRHNVLRAFRDALRRAGLPQAIHFHDLRHAHATNLLRAGVGIKTASSRLGHSGITITGDLYQHVASEMHQEAAERAAQVLRVAK